MAIYAWPPVGLKSIPVWTVRDPTRRSTSLTTGRRYVSSHARRRIYAEFSVSAKRAHTGAGYMESLKRLLDGGVNYVRLTYRPHSPITGRPERVSWFGDGGPVNWYESGQVGPVEWFTSQPGYGVPVWDADLPAVRVSGFAPLTRIAIPGEFIRVGAETRQVLSVATTDAAGEAVIRIDVALSASGMAIIGEAETGIFEALRPLPDGGGPLMGDYTYDWRFLQVFPEDIGAQVEIDPWR